MLESMEEKVKKNASKERPSNQKVSNYGTAKLIDK